MDKEEITKILLEVKAVILNPKNPFKFVSGILSPIYCDNRLILSYPDKRKKIVESFLEMIENKKLEFDVIAGVATSGIPWAILIAEKLNKPLIYVRSEKKDHGKESQIEGKLKGGERVIVVEDLISTGDSSINVVKTIREKKGIVKDCLAIFNYKLKKSKENFDKENCELHCLCDFPTLIEVAVKNNYIKEDFKNKILEWREDPEKWGQKIK